MNEGKLYRGRSKSFRKRRVEMKRKRILAVTVIVAMCICQGCGFGKQNKKTKDVNALTLKGVLEEVNKKNAADIDKYENVDTSQYDMNVQEEPYTVEEAKELGTPKACMNVDKEQAKSDVDTLFRVIKSSYGGYKFFGGDEKFDAAKEKIIADIDNGMDDIDPSTFAAYIARELSFFNDSHFVIQGLSVGHEAYCYYESSAMKFYKSGEEYYTYIDSKKWYISDDIKNYMKLTIAEDGELVYGMFTVCTDGDAKALPETVTLNDGENENRKTKTIDIFWARSQIGRNDNNEYKYEEKNDVPIQTLKGMQYATKGANGFIDDAKKMSASKNSMVDLRANAGGLTTNDLFWFYNYTGSIIDIDRKCMTIASEFNSQLMACSNKKLLNFDVDLNNELIVTLALKQYNILKNNSELFDMSKEYLESQNIKIPDGQNKCKWTNGFFDLFDKSKEPMVQNDNTLFVLQGKEDYSAGEVFVFMSQRINNTLRVGTNTNGCIATGPITMFYLPESGLSVQYSVGIITGNDIEFDTYGIEPDVYIGGQDAREAVLKCIDYYKE